MAISLSTEDKLEYQFYPVTAGQIQFRVKAPNDTHIALTRTPHESDPMFEIFIGGWDNTKSVIRKNRTKPDVVEEMTEHILDETEYRGFWIRWDGVLTVGKEGDVTPFMSYADPDLDGISYFGVCTGWGATGEWLIEDSVAPSAPMEVRGLDSNRQVTWCEASGGEIPSGGVVGGNDDEDLYIGRANHEGALIPGKIKPSHGVCYIAWGGKEHSKDTYEVLCNGSHEWIKTQGNDIPETALVGGEAEDGEPLFIGRVDHDNTMTLGKVQRSHNVCYIPYGGEEVACEEFEVLCEKK